MCTKRLRFPPLPPPPLSLFLLNFLCDCFYWLTRFEGVSCLYQTAIKVFFLLPTRTVAMTLLSMFVFLAQWLLVKFLAQNSTTLESLFNWIDERQERLSLVACLNLIRRSPALTAKHTFSSCCWCSTRFIDPLRNQLSVQRCVDQHLLCPLSTLMEYKLIDTSFLLHIDRNPLFYCLLCVNNIPLDGTPAPALMNIQRTLRVCFQVASRSQRPINNVFMTTTKNYCYFLLCLIVSETIKDVSNAWELKLNNLKVWKHFKFNWLQNFMPS